MNNPKTGGDSGAPERCVLCFSVDRTLSTVNAGVICHGFGLTVALPPDHPLLACWECHATLVRLQRFKQRSVQALLLLGSVHKHAELKCLSPLSRSSMIVIDFNINSLEQAPVSRSPSPAADSLMGCAIDEIKIDIDEDFDKLPQCNAWVQPVDLKNEIPIAKEKCTDNEVLKKYLSVDKAKDNGDCPAAKSFDDAKHDSMDIIDISDDDEKVGDEEACSENCNDKNARRARLTQTKKRPKKSITADNERKAKIEQEKCRKIEIGSADDIAIELLNLIKEGKIEEFIGNDEEMQKARKGLERILPNKVRCPACFESFPGKETLRVHTLERHSEVAGAHACDICGLRFTAPEPLTEHRAAHYKLYRCLKTAHSVCDFVSPSPGLSVFHVRMHVPSGPTAKWATGDELIKMIERRIVEKFVGTTHEVLWSRQVLLSIMKECMQGAYNCTKCIIALTSQQELNRHNAFCHSEAVGPHVCDICGCRFPTSELLAAHGAEHYTLYRCRHPEHRDCDFACSMPQRVIYHIHQHDRVKKTEGWGLGSKHDTTCNLCGGVFRTRQYFLLHMHKHTSTASYECDTCGKTYNTRLGIHRHIKEHAMKYVCETCGKRCPSNSALKKHSLAHMDPALRRFECHECQQKFISRAKLLAHLRSHLGERPYMCEDCPRDYAEPYQLTRHRKRVHEGEVRSKKYTRTKSTHRNAPASSFDNKKKGSFKCSICGKTFEDRSVLREHFSTHDDTGAYKCDQCDKSFKVYPALQNHKFLHQSTRPFKCDICGSAYASKSSLSNHVVEHSKNKPHECNICHKRFMYRSKMLKHLKIHNVALKKSVDSA